MRFIKINKKSIFTESLISILSEANSTNTLWEKAKTQLDKSNFDSEKNLENARKIFIECFTIDSESDKKSELFPVDSVSNITVEAINAIREARKQNSISGLLKVYNDKIAPLLSSAASGTSPDKIKKIEKVAKNPKTNLDIVVDDKIKVSSGAVNNKKENAFLYELYLGGTKNFPDGVGPAECLLGILNKNAQVSGGSKSFDLEAFGQEIEVKQGYKTTKNGESAIFNFRLAQVIAEFQTNLVFTLKDFLDFVAIFAKIESGSNEDISTIFENTNLIDGEKKNETLLEALGMILKGEVAQKRLDALYKTIEKIANKGAIKIDAKIVNDNNKWFVFTNGKSETLSEFIGDLRKMLLDVKTGNMSSETPNEIMKIANEIIEKNGIMAWIVDKFKNYLSEKVTKSWIIIDGEIKKGYTPSFEAYFYTSEEFVKSIISVSITSRDIKPFIKIN